MCVICSSQTAMLDPVFSEAAISSVAGPFEYTSVREAEVSEIGDAASFTTTNYSIAVGDTFSGSISTGGDEDWVAVDLVAGQSYVFSVWGTGGSADGVDDTVLTLYNSSGSTLRYNDDVTASYGTYVTFSLIEYTAQQSGTYYLGVESFGSETGDYTVQAATNVYTIDQIASYITEFDWGHPAPLAFDAGPGSTVTVNITGLTADGRQLARWAFEAWENATGLTFQETSGSAQITFDDNQSGAFAGPTAFNPNTGVVTTSSVNIGTGWLNTNGTSLDSYSFQTYIHEIGHALGLGHAGPYDGVADYGIDNIYLNDSTQVTVMSYFDPQDNSNVDGDDVAIVTPMVADLVAIHGSYGTPQAYQGNTVWGANSNVGGYLGTLFGAIFDGESTSISVYAGGDIGLTIFDTGGTDTLDVSTMSQNQVIDLRPEGVSNIGGLNGNIVVARDTIIEEAIGGTGHDRIFGNAANNTLTGGAGNDTISGGGGSDTAVLNVASGSATVTQSGQNITIQSALGTDVYTSVESFQFTDGTFTADQLLNGGGGDPVDTLSGTPGSDTLIGTAGNDSIDGLGSDDTISGGDGSDTLLGGDGNDLISASTGNDSVDGGTGNDNIGGGLGDDSLYGSEGNDTLGGGRDDDLVDGGEDDDIVVGGPGNDVLYGRDGNDTMGAGYGNDTVFGHEGHDSLGGGTGRDDISGGAGNDSVGGGEGDDTITGESGDDFLAGGGRNDLILGNLGNDTINGGAGDDIMYGDEGADVFVFNSLNAGEVDFIGFFEDGLDTIRMRGVAGVGQHGKFDALDLSNTTINGYQSVELEYDGHIIQIQGVSVSDLSKADFVFL